MGSTSGRPFHALGSVFQASRERFGDSSCFSESCCLLRARTQGSVTQITARRTASKAEFLPSLPSASLSGGLHERASPHQSIKAFVQVRADHVPSDALAATLIEHVRRELGPIATPSSLEFVASLPKTRSGKILRRFLKAKEAGVDAGDVSTMEG